MRATLPSSPTRLLVLCAPMALLLCGAAAATLQVRFPMPSVTQSGQRLSTTTYLSISRRGFGWCARECQSRARCLSFHYGLHDLSCHLNAGSAASGAALEDSPGFLYTDVNLLPQGLAGVCDRDDCSVNEKCVTDGQHPLCLPTECAAAPPVVAHSQVTQYAQEVGGLATYACDSPLWGPSAPNLTATCLSSGQWSPPSWTCQGLCPTSALPTVANAEISGDVGDEEGSVNTYACVSSLYSRQGPTPSTTCLPGHTWSAPDFACVHCPSPPAVADATVVSGSDAVGYTRTYACNSGFVMSGPDYITCSADAVWAAVTFTCDKVPFVTEVTGATGALISRNYPDPYPDSEDLTYTITIPGSQKNVRVTVQYDIQDTASCLADYLTIADDGVKYCGNDEVTKTVMNVASSFTVHFVSDCCGTSAKGFFLTYIVL